MVDWLIEMECGNDTFYGGRNWRKPLEQGQEIATNSTHETWNSGTENQTCTIVKAVSRDIAKPQLHDQFSGKDNGSQQKKNLRE